MRNNIKKDFFEKDTSDSSYTFGDKLKESSGIDKTEIEDWTNQIKQEYYNNKSFSDIFSKFIKEAYFKHSEGEYPMVSEVLFNSEAQNQNIKWDVEFRKNSQTIIAKSVRDFWVNINPELDSALDIIYKNDMKTPDSDPFKEGEKKYLKFYR